MGVDPKGACIPVQFTFVPPTQVFFGDEFTIEVEADVNDSGIGTWNECKEDNNRLSVSSICAS